MSDPAPPVCRGVRALRRLLREHDHDVRRLDADGFRPWLADHLAGWARDPAFAQRALIRDLRRAHPDLRTREREVRAAAAADAASPLFARLAELRTELTRADRAVAGLTAAADRPDPERADALRRKLAAFRERRDALQDELARRTRESPERVAWLAADERLRAFRVRIGLDRVETRLAELLTERGRHAGGRGAAFERAARAVTDAVIVPDLLRCHPEPRVPPRVLRGVTLGAARVEFDLLVVRPPRRPGGVVEVLAAVEVKRNANDAAHGFRLREENLAWLTGDRAEYDPARYRTRHFATGHFDRGAEHPDGGETFRFGPGSFRQFRRDPATGRFLRRLYLVTRPGPLWGVPGAALSRLAARVASDEHWAPDDPGYLRALWHWCRSLAGGEEAADVLRLYTASPRLGRQVVLVGGAHQSGRGTHAR